MSGIRFVTQRSNFCSWFTVHDSRFLDKPSGKAERTINGSWLRVGCIEKKGSFWLIMDLEELDHDIREFRIDAPKNEKLQAAMARVGEIDFSYLFK